QRPRSVSLPVLRRALRLSGRAAGNLRDTLAALEKKGRIVREPGDRYTLPRDLRAGKIEVNPRGFGFVALEEGGDDIYVGADCLGGALHGDAVLVRVFPGRRPGMGPGGEVVRILERGREAIVGTLAGKGKSLYLIPDNPSLLHDILIRPGSSAGARPGQKVTVRIVSPPAPDRELEGEVAEVLGEAGVPAVDTLSVIRRFALRQEFPEEAYAEAAALPSRVLAEERADRLDLRGTATFTVDPEDARDFDDAVSLEKSPEGDWILGVHISDVSHYVRAGTAIEAEARLRGTSVYFPAAVLHMLPPPLSTGICSLLPGEERLTLSAFITFSPDGRRLGYRFARSVIRSRRRFTYGEVRKIILDRDPAAREREAPLLPVLDAMGDLARALRRLRFERGALDLDLPEEKIVFDEEGLIAGIELEEQDFSHALIEEFMLAANEASADFLSRRNTPLIYRVHAPPEFKALKEFKEIAAAFGYRIGDVKDRAHLQAFLDEAKGSPLGYTLHTAFLRSPKRAEYSEKNIGHFGLASSCYVYFTSPIRRYPDLYLHRLLTAALSGGKPERPADLAALARHCTETEQASDKAEREVVLLRKLQFFAQALSAGAVFEGVITGVREFGLIVYLNRYLIGGLIPVSALSGDYYRREKSGTALRGRRTGRRFRLGDAVKVTVEGVDMRKKQVDFSLVRPSAG
ncbi:MAG: ribonuclease R, partial [Candidatus Aureabacteria bacterium]|nr:ribonuclease R [Candidatus Auribacterota bacterium]